MPDLLQDGLRKCLMDPIYLNGVQHGSVILTENLAQHAVLFFLETLTESEKEAPYRTSSAYVNRALCV